MRECGERNNMSVSSKGLGTGNVARVDNSEHMPDNSSLLVTVNSCCFC